MSGKALEAAAHAIVHCNSCERLRTYCQRIAVEKRAAYRDETYWARPVPGFGDPNARIVLVGLAPAAHGANRTGRVFTGDGAGGSGDFLMTALHANGLANQPYSRSIDDGLRLHDVWIAAAVRCAPPDNKPTTVEIATCHAHLRAELAALPRAAVYVALGRLAFDRCWRVLGERGIRPVNKPRFGHGAVFRNAGAPAVVASFHPSRQNTQTGRLTPQMLAEALATARTLVHG
jgi:uracil-DNA glycosylase family 4